MGGTKVTPMPQVPLSQRQLVQQNAISLPPFARGITPDYIIHHPQGGIEKLHSAEGVIVNPEAFVRMARLAPGPESAEEKEAERQKYAQDIISNQLNRTDQSLPFRITVEWPEELHGMGRVKADQTEETRPTQGL